ncbi:MAG: FkbM family methyltransferase [Gemmatimonadetes bacterium]|nr:FkbM family methyltransferase [Gemmatimonadota bacterium]
MRVYSAPVQQDQNVDLAVQLRMAVVRSIGWYLRRPTPSLGRGRLMSWGTRLLRGTPQVVRLADDRRFALQFPRDRGWETLFFTRTFETGTTTVLRRVLRPDDVTVDIGANIGWYTTLFGRQCQLGHCHAFEPEPTVFGELAANCGLNGLGPGVTLNNMGLAEKPGTATIYRFDDLPHGHSSLSPTLGSKGHGVTCQVSTLDRYGAERGLSRVDLIKMDVEGAELMVLKGSETLFSLTPPPIWLLEVNFATSRAFGYQPSDLFAFLSARHDFRFFRVVGGWGKLVPMRDARECGPSDNVFCVPVERLDRISPLL